MAAQLKNVNDRSLETSLGCFLNSNYEQPVFITDSEANITFTNQYLVGISEEFSIGINIKTLIENKDFQKLCFDREIKKGKSLPKIFRFKAILVPDLGTVWMGTDITEYTFIKYSAESNVKAIEEQKKRIQKQSVLLERIFSNSPQGCFIFDSNFISKVPPNEALLSIVPDLKNGVRIDVKKEFLEKLALSKDELNMALSVFESSFDNPSLNFDVNSHLLPKESQLGQNTLQLFWSYTCSDGDNIDRILLFVQDVTSVRQLEREKFQLREKQNLFLSVMNLGDRRQSVVDSFLEKFKELTSEWEEYKQTFKTSIFKNFYRHVHTLKGNARLYKFDQIVDVCHQIESIKSENLDFEIKISESLKKLQDLLSKVEKVLASFFNADKETITRQRVIKLIERIDNNVASFEEVRQTLFDTCFDSIASILANVREGTESVAKSLDKPMPQFKIGDDLYFKCRFKLMFSDCLSHLIANSLAHGIEDEATRVGEGKTGHGTISITTERSSDRQFVYIIYSDDGKGIDLAEIEKKAKEGGFKYQSNCLESLVNLLFLDSFSTADTVSTVAGRGVGLSAVKDIVERRMKGHAKIACKKIHEPSKFLPFVLELKLPLDVIQDVEIRAIS